jgi:hypothetical protein
MIAGELTEARRVSARKDLVQGQNGVIRHFDPRPLVLNICDEIVLGLRCNAMSEPNAAQITLTGDKRNAQPRGSYSATVTCDASH